jgi:hypothetical protein
MAISASGFSRAQGCRPRTAAALPADHNRVVQRHSARQDRSGLGLLNAARNTGGSIGISLANNVLWGREQFHQSRLVGQAVPSSVQYQDTLHQMMNYFGAQGSSLWEAKHQAIQWIGQQLQAQA